MDEFPDFSKSKKRARKIPIKVEEPAVSAEVCEPSIVKDPIDLLLPEFYEYEWMLKRAIPFDTVKPKNVTVTPRLSLSGKTVVIMNYNKVCLASHSDPKMLAKFIGSEFGCKANLADEGRRLNINGRFDNKHVQDAVDAYVQEYVICASCLAMDTYMKRERGLLFCQCKICGSSRTVSQIRDAIIYNPKADRIKRKQE